MGKNRCNRRRAPSSTSSAGGNWQRSKVKGRNNRGSSAFAEEKDVTLDAFANNACSRALAGRASKAIAMSVSRELKQVNASQILAKIEDEEILEDWYEGTFDDGTPLDEGYSARAEIEEADGDLQMSSEVPDAENDRAKLRKGASSSETDAYCVYNSIIWYLVSAYICPEDVGRFACLCRDTYAMTNTAGFWRRLYFRYYNTDSARYLPPDLHPTTIQRSFGLRSLVIRSLQYIYQPFAGRNSLRTSSMSSIFSNGNETVERIVGMRFMYHIGKHASSNYVYYLKFHRPEVEDQRAVEALAPNPDIHFNSHSGQCILMVICKFPHHFKLEGMMGMELVYVSMSVSAGMMYSRLKMEFQEPSVRQGRTQGHGRRDVSSRKCDRATVILDPVVQTRVCPWWHPHFQEEKFQVGSVPINENLNMWNAT